MKKIHTRESIKESTKNLIWEKGIKDTSIVDICKNADISRMTFYREYNNKNEIVIEIFSEHYQELTNKHLIILNKPIPFIERLNELIYIKLDFINNMSRNLINDLLHQKNPELKLLLEEQRQESFEILFQQIITEQKKGHFRKDINLEFLKYYINKLSEFMLDPNLISLFPDTSELIKEINKIFYFGILERY